jgi:hypothetical protein
MTRHMRSKHGPPKVKPAAPAYTTDEDDLDISLESDQLSQDGAAAAAESAAVSPAAAAGELAAVIPAAADSAAVSPAAAASAVEAVSEAADTKDDLDPGDLVGGQLLQQPASMFDLEDEILKETANGNLVDSG